MHDFNKKCQFHWYNFIKTEKWARRHRYLSRITEKMQLPILKWHGTWNTFDSSRAWMQKVICAWFSIKYPCKFLNYFTYLYLNVVLGFLWYRWYVGLRIWYCCKKLHNFVKQSDLCIHRLLKLSCTCKRIPTPPQWREYQQVSCFFLGFWILASKWIDFIGTKVSQAF